MPRLALLALASLLAASCAAAPTPPPDGGPGFVVHEWGVIVTAHDLDPIEGLPWFVHAGSWDPGMDPDDPVAEKPIVYFYPGPGGPDDVSVTVRIPAPGYRAVAYYPESSSCETEEAEESGVPARGIVEFDLELASGGPLPDRSPPWWDACRVPGAAHVSAGEEGERFLFYEAPLAPPAPPTFFSGGDAFVVVAGTAPVHDALWIRRDGTRLWYAAIDHVAASAMERAPVREVTEAALKEDLRRRLVGAGLFEDEADAMLRVWGESFDGAPPAVIYRLDPATVDATCPLAIDPVPGEVVRVWLVAGR